MYTCRHGHKIHGPSTLRATPSAEAMMALVLIDHALRQRGQNGDVEPMGPLVPAVAK